MDTVGCYVVGMIDKHVVVCGVVRREGRMCWDGDEPATDVHDRRRDQHHRRRRPTPISVYTSV